MTTTPPSEQEEFETRSMTLAAYLIGLGFAPRLVKISGKGRPFGVWRFAAGPAMTSAVEKFERGVAQVEPQSYHNTLSTVRTEVIELLKK